MKNKFSKWDVGGGSRSIIQGLNLFTSRNLFKSLKSILMVVALLSLSSNLWGADVTHDFAQSIQQQLNNSASISGINISEQSYAIKEVRIVCRYNKTINPAVTISVSVGGTSWGTQTVGNNFDGTKTFSGTAKKGAVVISFANNCGSGSGKGTFYVTNVQLVEGSSAPKVETSITLSQAGNESTVSGTYYVGDSYTLPSTTSATCGDKEFVGWSTVAISTPGAKPSSNYYDKGASVILAANNTFYAVFADAAGGGEASYKVTTTLTQGETYIFGAVKAAASSTLANNTTFGAVAFTNTYNSSSPNWGQRVDLTPDANGKIAATNTSITNECKWILESIDNGNYKFKKGTNYLYLGTSAGSTSGAQSGISTTGNCYIENVNSTCKDAFLLHPASSSTNIMLYNTSNGYRMYAPRSYSATMAPYVRFYEYDPGVTYSNYTTSCGPSTYTVNFSGQKSGHFQPSFLAHSQIVIWGFFAFFCKKVFHIRCTKGAFTLGSACLYLPSTCYGDATELHIPFNIFSVYIFNLSKITFHF